MLDVPSHGEELWNPAGCNAIPWGVVATHKRKTENVQEVVSLPEDCTSDFRLEILSKKFLFLFDEAVLLTRQPKNFTPLPTSAATFQTFV